MAHNLTHGSKKINSNDPAKHIASRYGSQGTPYEPSTQMQTQAKQEGIG